MQQKLHRYYLIICLAQLHYAANAQQGPLPPFTIELQEVVAPQLPGLHSFAKAQSGDKWLIVTGRTDGLHSFFPNSAFSPTEANQSLFVIDTDDWEVWSAPLSLLPYAIRTSLSATNTEFIQSGSQLYIIGGYGNDSLTDAKITFPTITALQTDAVINEIVAGSNNLAPYIRQAVYNDLAVTGGALQKSGSTYFLVGGHNFSGLYTKLTSSFFLQQYTNSISRFELEDDGDNLTINNFAAQTDTDNFHRRDLNAAPLINADGSESFGLYGGVFRYDKNLPYTHPVYFDESGAVTDFSFEQKMSQYTCPVVTCYDSVSHTMYTTFFGGISLYDCNDTTNLLTEDTLVPFINDITTLTRSEDGSTTESVLPVKFPGLYGANAEFFPAMNNVAYPNGVLKLNTFTGKQLIGYIYGGISTNNANEGYSLASNLLFRVFLTPTIATHDISPTATDNFSIFPNPTGGYLQISFSLDQVQHVSIRLMNLYGAEAARPAEGTFAAGNHRLAFNTLQLAAGLYTIRFISDDKNTAGTLMIMK